MRDCGNAARMATSRCFRLYSTAVGRDRFQLELLQQRLAGALGADGASIELEVCFHLLVEPAHAAALAVDGTHWPRLRWLLSHDAFKPELNTRSAFESGGGGGVVVVVEIGPR